MTQTPSQRISKIKPTLPEGTRLVAVSKYHPAASIEEAYKGGQRIFGESHVQELQQKHDILPGDIEWHFIGHLQTNKVKYIIPYVSLIHAVDSHRLLAEIDKQAERLGRERVRVLLQIHVAQEETKFGFLPEELMDYLSSGEWRKFSHVQICGLMCMASNVEDEEQIASEFSLAEQTFNRIRDEFFPHDEAFSERSWGMSDDYHIAVKHGSTLVRIGSSIFGARQY